MKKVFAVTFLMFMLCSLLLIGIAKAGNSAYSLTEYQWDAVATIDGKWTTTDEWTDGPVMTMSNNASFTYNMDFATYTIQWLVEIFNDTTTDAGDYWQICLDPDNGGGTTPKTDDFMIEIQGHNTLKVYKGTGTGWTEVAPAAGELTWANSIDVSPWGSTPHWILEISEADKTTGTIQTPQPPNGMRVAAYDASSSTQSSWAPNSDEDIPDQWGVIADFSQTPIPEGFSLLLVVLLSSVALVASFYLLRQRPKTQGLSSAKLEDIR